MYEKKTKKSLKNNGKDSTVSNKSRFAAEEFDSKNCKIRITTFIDMDVYDKLNELAEDSSDGYQTLLNKALRWSVLEANYLENDKKAKAIAEIEGQIKELEAKKHSLKMVS
jgi:uncharacterized protein (DUF4415 family)